MKKTYKSTVTLSLHKIPFILILFLWIGLGTKSNAQQNVQLQLANPCITVGVENQNTSGNGQLTVFPNPNNGSFIFDLTTNQNTDKIDLQILNSYGVLIYSKEYYANGSHFSENIDLHALPCGIYLIRISDGINVNSKKIIITDKY